MDTKDANCEKQPQIIKARRVTPLSHHPIKTIHGHLPFGNLMRPPIKVHRSGARWKIGSPPNSIVAISDDISQGSCVVAANLTFLKCPFGVNRDTRRPSGKAGLFLCLPRTQGRNSAASRGPLLCMGLFSIFLSRPCRGPPKGRHSMP
jgi:hypothetical protein